MIIIKRDEELEKMRHAGRMAAKLLAFLGDHVTAGTSTLELELLSRRWIKKHNVQSATLHYKGFPATICTSRNNVVCHGIPHADDTLQEGDILNIDVTLIVDHYHGDVSRTFTIGKVAGNIHRLVMRTERALMKGIAAVAPGAYLNDIGCAIEDFIKPFKYGIVTALCGHGIGRNFHEDPLVMHSRQSQKGPMLKPGMTFTIEPMINEGHPDVYTSQKDGWSVYTKDNSYSAQFEHTIAVLEHGYEILTLP
ncbi:methionine aminopeptidase [Spirochaetota bacterium]|nr:methionine aminopeptidase [Spirochaetota bacterium]